MQTRKLPVFQTFNNAFSFVVGNFLTILRLSWLPYTALLLVTSVLTPYVMADFFSGIGPKPANPTEVFRHMDKLFLFDGLIILLQAIVTAAVAVSIHRVILFADRREGQYVNFAFGKTELLYVLMGVLSFFGVIAVLATFLAPAIYLAAHGDVAGFFASFKDFPNNMKQLVQSGALAPIMIAYMVAWLVLMFLFLRLSVWPPAVVAQNRLALGEAWRLTRGNALRMLGLFILLALVIYAVAIPIGIVMAVTMVTNREAFGPMKDTHDPLVVQHAMRDMIGPYLPVILVVELFVYVALTGLTVALVSFAYKALKGVDANTPLGAGDTFK